MDANASVGCCRIGTGLDNTSESPAKDVSLSRSRFVDMKLARSWVLLLTLMTSSCALFQTAHLEPTADTAVVRSGQWGEFYRGGYVRIESVSGHTPSWRNSQEVAVGGGQQTGKFSVMLCRGSDQNCPELSSAELRFTTDLGHSYVVHAQEKINGSNQFWIWVQDQETAAVVGGEAPTP
jgi:hypothetical protein